MDNVGVRPGIDDDGNPFENDLGNCMYYIEVLNLLHEEGRQGQTQQDFEWPFPAYSMCWLECHY